MTSFQDIFQLFHYTKRGKNRRKERSKIMALTSENSKHVKVISYDFMKMRDVVSIGVNQGRFWKAEQLLERVRRTLPSQPPRYLPVGTPASRLPVLSVSAGAAPVPVAAQVTPSCHSSHDKYRRRANLSHKVSEGCKQPGCSAW